jgi:hypothetical protein
MKARDQALRHFNADPKAGGYKDRVPKAALSNL